MNLRSEDNVKRFGVCKSTIKKQNRKKTVTHYSYDKTII